MVFATRITEGAKGPEDCPVMDAAARQKLADYMGPFNLIL
ncbi:hypothetical protein JCM14469_24120 [Desulfatiferula olefinivorans]